jgi:hypothetical protein
MKIKLPLPIPVLPLLLLPILLPLLPTTSATTTTTSAGTTTSATTTSATTYYFSYHYFFSYCLLLHLLLLLILQLLLLQLLLSDSSVQLILHFFIFSNALPFSFSRQHSHTFSAGNAIVLCAMWHQWVSPVHSHLMCHVAHQWEGPVYSHSMYSLKTMLRFTRVHHLCLYKDNICSKVTLGSRRHENMLTSTQYDPEKHSMHINIWWKSNFVLCKGLGI